MTLLQDDDLTRMLVDTAATYEVPAYPSARGRNGTTRRPAQRKWRPALGVAAAAVVVSFLVAAVSQGGGGASQATSAGASSSPSSAAGSGGASADFQTQSGQLPLVGAPAPAASGNESQAGGASQGQSGVLSTAQQAEQGRVVKTGTVALIAKSGAVTPTLDSVGRVAREQGGSVFATQTQESGDTPSGTITVRVPVAQFDALVSAVRGLAEVRSVQTSGREVTAEYADLETRIASATAARNRLTTILGAAVSVAEVLAVQQQIDQTSATVDQLTGQLKVLKDQSDLSTLTVAVTETGDPAITRAQGRSGFGAAFRDAVDGFSSGLQSLVAASGRALLVLLVLAGLALVGWGVYRVGRRRLV